MVTATPRALVRLLMPSLLRHLKGDVRGHVAAIEDSDGHRKLDSIVLNVLVHNATGPTVLFLPQCHSAAVGTDRMQDEWRLKPAGVAESLRILVLR
jgi:hypothetical protein